jgi:hypothetical protein
VAVEIPLQMRARCPVRLAVLIVSAELLVLSGIVATVSADAEIAEAASHAEAVYRAIETSQRDHVRPAVLSLELPREHLTAAAAARPAMVIVRIGLRTLYRDSTRGCWQLPPPFGSRCWAP